MMKERIQQQMRDFMKMVSYEKANVNTSMKPSQEDSLSKAIRTEKDAKIFMAELKDLMKKARATT